MKYPKNYEWLGTLGVLPKMLQEALATYGTKETPGSVNNSVIMGWAKYLGVEVVYTADSVPWCGLWARYIAKRAGKSGPKHPLWALNWINFGSRIGQPCLGDIVVFTRDGGGHVGIYIAEDKETYHVLGGNQSDSVSITRIYKKRLVQARRPFVNFFMPKSVRPYVVSNTGVPIATKLS